MKRFRDVVFSTTEPTDKNVIWVYPVTNLADNDLYDKNLHVENFDGKLYKVFIWNECWEDLFYGPLTYIKLQLVDYLHSQLGDIPEGTTVIEILNSANTQINSLETVTNYLDERVEGLNSSKVDKIEGYGLSSNDFTDSYKNLLDTLFDGFMTFQTIVSTYGELPSSASNGDVYLVGTEIPYSGYIWSDVTNSFLPLGAIADLSNFYQKSETFTKQETNDLIDSKISTRSLVQKYQPQGVGYWRGGSMYPLLVDPQADLNQNVILGNNNRGILNFYEMHNFLQYQFDAAFSQTAKFILGGKRDTTKLDGYISLYNKTTERYNHLKAGSGTSSSPSDLTYFLPSPETDGGSKILATTAEATRSTPGLMTATDKTKLDNIDARGNIPIGGIIMWSGNERDVPLNWEICAGGTYTYNGETKTIPDLRGRFVMGSTANQLVQIDDQDECTTAKEVIQAKAGDTTITYREMSGFSGKPVHGNVKKHLPNHGHPISMVYSTSEVKNISNGTGYSVKNKIYNTDNAVNVTYNEFGNQTKVSYYTLPSFYVLAFIIRIA